MFICCSISIYFTLQDRYDFIGFICKMSMKLMSYINCVPTIKTKHEYAASDYLCNCNRWIMMTHQSGNIDFFQ